MSTPGHGPRSRFRSLDLLRGGAALGVVVYHQMFSDGFREAVPWLHRLFKVGDYGVAMFFVVSGYCIAAAADGGRRRGDGAGCFLRRRLARVFPPFWASLAVVAAAPRLTDWLAPAAPRPADPFATADAVEWVRVATLTQGYAPRTAQSFADQYVGFSGVYWTLGIEVQFYLIVALALRLGRAGGRFLGGVTAAGLVSLARQDLWVEGLFVPFWPQFAAGMAAFGLARSGRTAEAVLGGVAARALTIPAGAGLVAFAFAEPLARFNYCFERASFAAAFAAFLWLAGAWESRLAGGGRVVAAGLGFGAMSYSLYLTHGPMLAVAAAAWDSVAAPCPATDATKLLCVVAACVPFYFAAERPVLRWLTPPRGLPEGVQSP
jgi:peptidoglycan/LPS O-acetylase OafA/YrhL